MSFQCLTYDYPFGIIEPFVIANLFFFDLWLLIIRMVSPNDLSLYCTSFRFLASDFPFGICKRFVIALSVLSMFWLMIIKLFIYFTLCPTAS